MDAQKSKGKKTLASGEHWSLISQGCVLPRWAWGSVDRSKVALVDLWAPDNLRYSVDGLKSVVGFSFDSFMWTFKVDSFYCRSVFTSVRMSAGTPVAMRMVQSCWSRPHWYMDFWQLAVAPGEFTGDTMTRTNWEYSRNLSRTMPAVVLVESKILPQRPRNTTVLFTCSMRWRLVTFCADQPELSSPTSNHGFILWM